MATREETLLKSDQGQSKPETGKEAPIFKNTLTPTDTKVRITPKAPEEQGGANVAEAGADNDDGLESGDSVEEIILEEAEIAEAGASQGLFGGLGLAAGADVAATGGLASLGLLSGLTGGGGGDEPIEVPPKPSVQLAGVDSDGLTVGPSADGSGPQGLNLENTNVSLGAGKETLVTVSEVSLINPDAPVPTGNPLSVDPATQQLSANLGPVGEIALGATPEAVTASLIPLANSLTSGNIELEKVVQLDVPTNIAGTDVPITSTLNDGLTQLGDALSPVTDALSGALGSGLPDGGSNPLEGVPLLGDLIDQGPAALAGIPVIGDVVAQLEGSLPLDAVTGGTSGGDGQPIDNVPLLGPVLEQATGILGGPSPIGPLPVGNGTEIPTTVPELDLVTNQVTSAINSTAAGENPLAPIVSALPI
ncbi:MAG: hypothetical protein LW629_01565 [Burkholderiales bacterium]|nr:hypothetical protein [Burkholderiales bacterium]